MKLKYRIRKHIFPTADDFYSAEYKVLGIWMNINSRNSGRFAVNNDCECKTMQEAVKRVERHKLGMKRANEWYFRTIETIAFVLLLFLISSCGQDTPKFNDPSDPFIVDKIEHYHNDFSIYYATFNKGRINRAFAGRARICLPTGKYNIGDTVKIETAEDLWGDFLDDRLTRRPKERK